MTPREIIDALPAVAAKLAQAAQVMCAGIEASGLLPGPKMEEALAEAARDVEVLRQAHGLLSGRTPVVVPAAHVSGCVCDLCVGTVPAGAMRMTAGLMCAIDACLIAISADRVKAAHQRVEAMSAEGLLLGHVVVASDAFFRQHLEPLLGDQVSQQGRIRAADPPKDDAR